MLIPFQQFQEKVKALISEAAPILEKEINSNEDFSATELSVKLWMETVIGLLKTSFNFQNNHIERQFSLDYSSGARPELNSALSLPEKIKKKKAWLKGAVAGLQTKVNILSVCDNIINYDEKRLEEVKNYDTNEKLGLILRKLYKLPSESYYPVKELLEGNGLSFSSLVEPHELAITLKERDYIDLMGNGYARILVPGKLLVEDYERRLKAEEKATEKKSENKTMKNKTGKIFISHSSVNKDIVNKFCDLILHNGLNINVSQDVFNTSLEGSKPKTGEDFRNRIKDELMNAKIVLQFISKDYKESEVCLNEMGAAWVLSDNVMPLLIDKDEYEVGFIHSSTQQAQLHKKGDIFKLTDELIEKGVTGGGVKNEKLAQKIDEFIDWLSSHHAANTPKEVEAKTPTEGPRKGKENAKSPAENDVKMIRNYLESKKLTKISFSGLRHNVHSKFNDKFILDMIEKFPDEITRTRVQGGPGLEILYPDFEFN